MSQSFDWELSNRQPFEIPNTYLFIGTGYSNLLGNNDLAVPVDNTQILFSKFNGSAFNINIGVEYWLNEKISISPVIQYSKFNFDFNQVASYPIYNGEMLKLNNLYNLNNSLFGIGINFKYVFWNKLGINVNLEKNFAMKSSNSYNLSIISPEWYTFKDGTKSAELFNKSDDNTIGYLGVGLKLTYDYAINYPIYLTPYCEYNYGISSIQTNQHFNISKFSIGIQVNYGINNLKLF